MDGLAPLSAFGDSKTAQEKPSFDGKVSQEARGKAIGCATKACEYLKSNQREGDEGLVKATEAANSRCADRYFHVIHMNRENFGTDSYCRAHCNADRGGRRPEK